MLFTNRDLYRIAIPLMLQSILATTIGMIDSVMVASIGEAAVSGVALINSLDAVLVNFFAAMVAGGTVIISQYYGKGDIQRSQEAMKQLLYVTMAVALLITLFGQLFRKPMLHLLFGEVEEGVMYYADRYFLFISLSFPFMGIANACGAAMRAMGNSATPLLISIVDNGFNILLNGVFIYWLDMETTGAAIASLISRVIGATLLLLLMANRRQEIHIDRILRYRPDMTIIKGILRIGIPNAIENCMFSFGKLLTQSVVSTLGTASITANSVASNVVNYQYIAGASVGNASVIVVGRCIGAGEKEQARRYSRKLLLAAYFCVWAVVLVTALFVEPIIGCWQLTSDTAGLTRDLIIFHCICAALVWPLGFVLPSMFRAASDVKFPMVVSVTCMWIFRVAFSYVLAPEGYPVFGLVLPGFGMGVMGVWVAMIVDWGVRVVIYAWRYFSGKWLTVYDRLKD